MLQGSLPGPDLFAVETNSLLNKDLGDTYFYQIPMLLEM